MLMKHFSKYLLRNLLLILIIVLPFSGSAQNNTISIVSWNLQTFGKTKSDSIINFMAETVKDFDIVAVQEVVGKSSGGVKAVDRLRSQLRENCSKCDWKYVASGRTTGNPLQSERYAFFWKGDRIKIVGNPWLENNFAEQIEREPYMAKFASGKDTFTLVNFHAIPRSKQPEQEIKYFKYYPAIYHGHNLIFLGDFNLPQTHNVFNPLKKMGYKPVLKNQKTTLKMKPKNGEYLASELDNIFYHSDSIQVVKSGIIPFYQAFPDLVAARKISDHVPVYFILRMKEKKKKRR